MKGGQCYVFYKDKDKFKEKWKYDLKQRERIGKQTDGVNMEERDRRSHKKRDNLVRIDLHLRDVNEGNLFVCLILRILIFRKYTI